MPHVIFERAVTNLMKDLPDDRRQLAQQVLQQNRKSMQTLRVELQAARRSVAAAFQAEEFDETRLRNALDAMSKSQEAMRVALRENAMVLVKELNQSEREQLFRYFKRSRIRGRGMPKP